MTTVLPDRPADDRLDPAFLRLGLVMMTGVLAVVFDTTIVSVALRSLATDLHAPIETIQWVTTGYLLALGIAIPVTGWLVDRFGGKHVWLVALAVFLLGSLAASVAQSAGELIATRVVQGVGSGLMLPVMQTVLMRAAGGRSLGRVTATIGLPVLLGPVFGPLLGGLIVTAGGLATLFTVMTVLALAVALWAIVVVPAVTPAPRNDKPCSTRCAVSPTPPSSCPPSRWPPRQPRCQWGSGSCRPLVPTPGFRPRSPVRSCPCWR